MNQLNLIFEQFKLYFIIGILLFAFLFGAYATHLWYAADIKDREIRTQELQLKLDAALSDVRVEYITKTVNTTSKGEVRTVKVIEYIPLESIDAGFIEYLNAAADNRPLAVLTPEQIATPTGKTLRDAAISVNNNYTSCNKYITQIEALQHLITEFNEVNK